MALDGGVTYPTEGCPCPGSAVDRPVIGEGKTSGRRTVPKALRKRRR